MPSSPAIFLHGRPYFISFRTEEGLPFVSLPLINEILWSCVAKAQQLYAQELIALTIEPNHGHLMLRCTDPEKVPAFIGYIKQESSHAINRLTGRKRKTNWVKGFGKPILLDYKKFLDRLAYVLLNPYKDQLVPEIKKFKGVSSWSLFMKDKNTRRCRMISRSSVTALNDPDQPWKESSCKLKELFKENTKETSVRFDFYSWKSCFPETAGMSNREVRELMLTETDKFAAEAARVLKPKSTYQDLGRQSLLRKYVPIKFGKKMICLSFFKELRMDFIDFFKDKVRQAREIYLKWKQGDFSEKFPAGMFAPPVPRLINMVPSAVPI